MTYTVLGNSILIEVQKVKDTYNPGGRIQIIDTEKEKLNLYNNSGIVRQIGNFAFKKYGDGEAWCKEGDKVHFVRYGAYVIQSNKDDDFELWVVLDKDLLAIEHQEKKKVKKEVKEHVGSIR